MQRVVSMGEIECGIRADGWVGVNGCGGRRRSGKATQQAPENDRDGCRDKSPGNPGDRGILSKDRP
jgi:hypothetical protein